MMIDKLLSVPVLAAMVFCACTRNESVVNSGNDVISFSGYTGRAMTRAADKYSGKYHVYAYFGGDKYFDDTFENNKPEAESGKTYYWPTTISSSTKMSFYGVAPAETELTDDHKISAFDASDGTVDLVVAKSSDYASKADNVALTFQHALSQIASFKLISDTSADGSATADYTYYVSSLKVTAKPKGDCSIATGEPVWTNLQGDPKDYVYISSSSEKSFKGDDKLEITTPVNDIVPQEVTITVEYRIAYTGAGDESPVLDKVEKSGTVTLGPKTSYAITITLTNDNKPIIFNAEDTGWAYSAPSVDVYDAFEEIRTLLASTTGSSDGIVKLNKDYVGQCTETIIIPDGKILDLNGHTLNAEEVLFCDTFIQVGDSSDVDHQARLYLNGKIFFKGSPESCVVDLHTAKARIDNFRLYPKDGKMEDGSDWVDGPTNHWNDNNPSFVLSSGSASKAALKRSVMDDTDKFYAFFCSNNNMYSDTEKDCVIGSVSGFSSTKKQIAMVGYTGDGTVWTTLTDMSFILTGTSSDNRKETPFTENKVMYGVTFTPSMFWVDSCGGPT